MKILILSRGVPNAHDPQEGCFELDQAKALKAAGHEVVVMAVDSRVRKFWRKIGIEKKNVDGIKTYKLFVFPSSIIRRLLSFRMGVNIEWKEAIGLYKHIIKREGEFDLIHAHFLTSIFYAHQIKKKYGIPVVATEHWSQVNTDTPKNNVVYMATRAYTNANALISVSKSLQKRIKDNFNIDSSVIHNLIDTSYLLPIDEKKSKSETFQITLVGSLVKGKGFDFFIKSFAKSQLVSKNVIVKIIGGGPEYSSLSNLIKDLDLTPKIVLLNQQHKSIIFKELSTSNVFVLPSRNENFSVSVLEALANGLPVIATICGGIRECIDERNGILVEVDNEKQMVWALEQIYEKYESFNFTHIQQDCLSKYSPQSIAKQLECIYSSVISDYNHV